MNSGTEALPDVAVPPLQREPIDPEAAQTSRLRGTAREVYAAASIAQRDLAKLRRDHLRLAVNLAFPVVLVIGLGNILAPTVGRETGLDELDVAFSGVLAATLFQSTAAGMVSLVEDRENDYARQLFVAPVSRLTLVGGKVMGETLVALAQGALLLALAVAAGVPAGPVRLMLLVGPAIACCLLGAAFGLATIAALPNQRSAMQVFQFLIVPQYVLAGVLVPVHSMPAAARVLAWAMPLRYGVDLMQAAYYAGHGGYTSVVSLNPAWDGAALAVLFVALMLAGVSLSACRERHK